MGDMAPEPDSSDDLTRGLHVAAGILCGVERPLTEWEWAVLSTLTSVDPQLAMAVEKLGPISW